MHSRARMGAGRKPGSVLGPRIPPDASPAVVTESLAQYIERSGMHPVAELIRLGVDPKTPIGLRVLALSNAAPYCAPKLAATVVMTASAGQRPDAGAELLERLSRLDVPLLIEGQTAPKPLERGSRREVTLAALSLLDGAE